MTSQPEIEVVDGQDISRDTMPLLRATSIAQQMERRCLAETSSPSPVLGSSVPKPAMQRAKPW